MARRPSQFTITDDHLKLVERFNIMPGNGYWDSPMVDPKRPFGNSCIDCDIADILGWDVGEDGPTDEQSDQARAIHDDLGIVMEIICANVRIGISPGIYLNHGDAYRHDWKVQP